MKVMTKCSMTEAEIDSLLHGWIQARRKVWDALFGLSTANVPAPWREVVAWSVGSYKQVMESLLKAQAADMSAALRALGQWNAWGEGMQRFAQSMMDTQGKNGEAWSAAIVGPQITPAAPVDASKAAKETAALSSRGASTGVAKGAPPPAKETSAPSKADQRPTTVAA